MVSIVRDISPESLALANEAHLAAGLAACARAFGGEVYDEPDLLWCASELPSAGFNRVARAHLIPETVDARIEWVIRRAHALHVPFQWSIGRSMLPVGLGEQLLRHGFIDGGEEPAMGVALDRLPQTLSLPDGVTVERVADSETMAQWARTMSVGFGGPATVEEAVVAVMSRGGFGDGAPVEYYIARLHGEPVATSGLSLAVGVAGILAVSTIPSARRQGIGTAITLAPLLEARERGYCVGVLQASELGYPVYSRMGFTEQFRYHNYIWRPA